MPSYPAKSSVPDIFLSYEKGGDKLLSGVRNVETLVRKMRWCACEGLGTSEKTDIYVARSRSVLECRTVLCHCNQVHFDSAADYTGYQDLRRPLQPTGQPDSQSRRSPLQNASRPSQTA